MAQPAEKSKQPAKGGCSMCRQTPKHVIASRRERSPDRSAVQALRRHVGMPPYGVAIRSFSKSCIFKAFRMRIATPLFAFGKNADIGHSLQVLGDEGALELVRAFGRFAMTEYLLCLQSEQPAKGGCLLWRREAESKR